MCANEKRIGSHRPFQSVGTESLHDYWRQAVQGQSAMVPSQRYLLEAAIRARVPSRVGNRLRQNQIIGEVSVGSDVDIVHLFPELHEEAAQIARSHEAAALRARLTSALLDVDPVQCREIGDLLRFGEFTLQTLATMLFWPVATHLRQLSVTGNESHAQISIATVRLAKLVERTFDDQTGSKSLADPERRLVIARTEGAVHALGVSIVSAMFQKMGWSVEGEIFLRKSSDLDDVVEQASCNLIAVSVGNLHALPTCRQAISRVRKLFPWSPTKIAIGGPVVLENSRAFRSTAADYFVRSTFDVMRLARGDLHDHRTLYSEHQMPGVSNRPPSSR